RYFCEFAAARLPTAPSSTTSVISAASFTTRNRKSSLAKKSNFRRGQAREEKTYEYRRGYSIPTESQESATGRIRSGDSRRRYGFHDSRLYLRRTRSPRGRRRPEIHRRIVPKHRVLAEQKHHSQCEGRILL